MLLPKLRHTLGSLAFSDFFLVKKRHYPCQITFWKYNEKSFFFDFLKYTYLRIFSLTPSRSRKLITKANLKWECTYFYSNFFKSFGQYFKKSKMDFPFYFQKFIWLPKICLSFGGSMPEGQFKQCPLTPPSTYRWRCPNANPTNKHFNGLQWRLFVKDHFPEIGKLGRP